MHIPFIITTVLLCYNAGTTCAEEDQEPPFTLHDAIHFLSVKENVYARFSEEIKTMAAQSMLKYGFLDKILVNNQLTPTAQRLIKQYKRNPEKLYQLNPISIDRCLTTLNTVTSRPLLLTEYHCTTREKDGLLKFDLEDKELATVCDWKRQPFFAKVAELNLAYNPLHELPAEFFKLFPLLERINIRATQITHIDTTYMPDGLLVIAQDSKLRSINPTRLPTGRLTINALDTPLSTNLAEVRRLRRLCTQAPRSWFAHVCCYYLACVEYDEGNDSKISI